MPWWNLVLIAILILASGLFSGTEAALIASRRAVFRGRAARGDRRAGVVSRLLEEPGRPLSTIVVANTLIAFFVASIGTVVFAVPLAAALEALGEPLAGQAQGLAVFLVTVALTLVILVFGELVPKRLGIQFAEAWLLRAGPALERLIHLTRPLVWLLGQVSTGVLRAARVPPGPRRITEEELRAAIDEGRDEGVLGGYEAQMLQSVLLFTQLQASEVMVPRTDIVAVDRREPVSEARRKIVAAGYRRLPVVDGTIDRVLGIVYADDLLLAEDPDQPAGERLRPVLLVPESKSVLELLSEFRRRGQEIAVVLDEYGGTAGLITLEDLVEEIVGDIDELLYHADLRRRLAARPQEGVEGSASLRELNALYHLSLPVAEYDTLGGFVQGELGRLPRPGDAVEWDGWRFTVVRMRGRRIERVRMDPLERAQPEPQPGYQTSSG